MAFNNSKDVRIARDANNVVYGDQNNYAVNTDGELLRLLAQNAAPNACYDSEQRFPPPNCHEGTRLQILEKLSSRIEDKYKANNVLWLHGSAGVGKSAIAQHLAEKYARSGRLGAAFFFSRSDSSRDKIRPLVASIAYQFCKPGSPFRTTLGPAIIDTIRSDPNIFHTSCENQIQQLLVELSSNLHTAATEEQGFPPYLIIIDGLDECIDRAEQERVLAIVEVLISHSAPYFSWIILLCSRPEPQIRHGFDHEGFERHLETFDVNALDDVNRDIHRYLVDNFATLRTKYRRAMGREESSWPGEDVIGKLIARADGQFIFAATVIKYLDVDDEPPQDRLDTIMRIYVEQEESPYSALDILYHQILLNCRNWGKVRALLRLLVTPHLAHPGEHFLEHKDWRSLKLLALFLNIEVHEFSTLLIRLHSVLKIPEGTNIEEEHILFAHASFPEFLTDPKRSGNFHAPALSELEYRDSIAACLLRALAAFTPSYPLYHLESFDSGKLSESWFEKLYPRDWLVELACESWDSHCTKVVSPSEDLLEELENMDVYVVVDISLNLSLRFPLDWHGVIKWAKVVFRSHVNKHCLTNNNIQALDLGNWRIDELVKKLEMTMMEVQVALEPCLYGYLERRRIFGGIFNTEKWLLGPKRDGAGLDVQSFVDAILRELRASSPLSHQLAPWIPGSNHPSSRRKTFLIVPGNIIMQVSNILPIVRMTRDNVRVFQRIYGTLNGLDSWSPTIRLLLGHVVDRTLTISDHTGDLVRFSKDVLEKDLVCFATFFKERLAVLNLDVNFSEGSFWLVDIAGQSNAYDTCNSTSLTSNNSISGSLEDSRGLNDQQVPSSPSSSSCIGSPPQETLESDRAINTQQPLAPEDHSTQPPTHSQICTLPSAVGITLQPNRRQEESGSRHTFDVDDHPKGEHNHQHNCCCLQ
ncbi:hypothetical protein VNI00_008682 [Paramarasmius palmivorus]|uniref:NACHT domain-containing protein n=1 Tax=Paramarasmius palmivorus TaxID=297713 RepID=A0AAW0CXK5_9AGAR